MSERLKTHIQHFKEEFLKAHPNKAAEADVAKTAEDNESAVADTEKETGQE